MRLVGKSLLFSLVCFSFTYASANASERDFDYEQHAAKVGQVEHGSWVYSDILHVQNTNDGQPLDEISMDFRAGMSGLDTIVLTGEISSGRQNKFILHELSCTLKKDIRFARDEEAGTFNCASLPGEHLSQVIHETDLPAASRGDGMYYIDIGYNIQSIGGAPSSYRHFESSRYECRDGRCIF